MMIQYEVSGTELLDYLKMNLGGYQDCFPSVYNNNIIFSIYYMDNKYIDIDELIIDYIRKNELEYITLKCLDYENDIFYITEYSDVGNFSSVITNTIKLSEEELECVEYDEDDDDDDISNMLEEKYKNYIREKMNRYKEILDI